MRSNFFFFWDVDTPLYARLRLKRAGRAGDNIEGTLDYAPRLNE